MDGYKKMRNRAKCKLCNSIIESFHSGDHVTCKCGEISVHGGQGLYCASKDWNNFTRVDDNGHEIVIRVLEKDDVSNPNIELTEYVVKPNKKELIDMLDEMVKSIDSLPPGAMTAPITHYDLSSALLLLLAIFKAES